MSIEDNLPSSSICQLKYTHFIHGVFLGGIVNSLLQEFHYVKPSILTRLVLTYATSFYGSGLWNLFSKECEKLYTSWNVTIRQIFNISRRTHRYLIEPVSLCQHLKTSLAARFVTFVHSLINSNKFSVRFLARLCQADKRTVLSRAGGKISDLPKLSRY